MYRKVWKFDLIWEKKNYCTMEKTFDYYMEKLWYYIESYGTIVNNS